MPSAETLTTPVEQHDLAAGAFISMPLDAAPLETHTTEDGKSEDILARMRRMSGKNAYGDYQPAPELLLVRDDRGRVVFRPVNQYGEQHLPDMPARQKYSPEFREISTLTAAPDVQVLFSAPKDKKDTPTITIAYPATGHDLMRITTAEGAARQSQSGEQVRSLGERNRQKQQGKLRKWLAGIALVGAVAGGADKTGGLYDMIGDANSDAGTSVEHDFTGATPDEQAAIDRVARTMQDLDNHNNDVINQRAAQFKEQHKDEFVPEAETAQTEADIEKAPTPTAVISTLDKYLHLYGKTADARQENDKYGVPFQPDAVPVDILRQHALGVIDAYSFLPKKMVQDAQFTALEFASPAIDPATGERFEDGLYDKQSDTPGKITLVVTNDYGKDTRRRFAEVTLHETGHAGDDQLDPYESTGLELDAAGSFNYFLKYMTDNPNDVSQYAAANGHNEKYAEDNAYLLDNQDNGLAHPDDIRLFNSTANRQLLGLLIQDDEKFPGIADYIAQHSGVENRQNNLFNS